MILILLRSSNLRISIRTFQRSKKVLSIKSKFKIMHIDDDYLAISPDLRNVLKINSSINSSKNSSKNAAELIKNLKRCEPRWIFGSTNRCIFWSFFLFEGSEENWRNDEYERGWTHGGRYETTIGRVSRITKCVGEFYGTRFETL